MSEYLTFRKYATAEEALSMQEFLQAGDIPAVLEETPVMLDQQLIGQHFDNTFLLKIPAALFSAADALIRQLQTTDDEDADPDYYLLAFSEAELREVIEKKDEWGEYDYALALKLLEKKGVTFTPAQLAYLDRQRKEQLARPEAIGRLWLWIGFLSAFIGGLLGFFIGGFLWYTKKTLPDGTRVYAYTPAIRKQGTVMLCVGTVMTPLWIWYIMAGGSHPSLRMFFHLLFETIF